MAKKTAPTADPAPAPTELTPADRKLVLKSICAVTGCGRIEAEKRLTKLSDRQTAQIAKHEAAGNRRAVIPILYP